MGDLINKGNITGELVEVKIRDGASLLELVNVILQHLHKSPFDVVYIVGGSCDITSKVKINSVKRIVYNWRDKAALGKHLLKSLSIANEALSKDFPASKVVCQLIASDLKRVVTYGTINLDDQNEVEEAVWKFNTEVFRINKETGTISPSLHHQVHRFCKGKRRAYYHHLQDGLHLSDYLKGKWADEFVTVMSHN